jgi:hypothetical protein
MKKRVYTDVALSNAVHTCFCRYVDSPKRVTWLKSEM